MASTHAPSFSRWRRLVIGFRVALATASVLALAFMANYLAAHYAPRIHWGAANNYRLSPLTRVALDSLTNQVRVTVFFDRTDSLYPSVRALLREYSAASPRIEIHEIDYLRYPAIAQEFRKRHPVPISEDDPNLVLFESMGQTKMVAARDLRDYDPRALLQGEEELRPVTFKGERLFTSAITSVCEGKRRQVFFLRGHGEHDFESKAPQTGYQQFADVLRDDNVEVTGLELSGAQDVPAECELLIVAGARDPLSASEQQSIDRYLRRGGRLLVLFQHQGRSGLENLLSDWGVVVEDTLVLDPENSDQMVLIVSRFGNHPVTRPLGGTRIYLYLPRAVEPRQVANILGAPARIVPLLRTGTNATAVTTLGRGRFESDPSEPGRELPLAVAVERGALPGVAANLGTTRIVVVGESTFLANGLINRLAGNRHFATSTVNWLLDRSYLLGGIPPAPIHTYQVTITPFQQRMLRTLLLLVLPGGALVMGFFVWWRRH